MASKTETVISMLDGALAEIQFDTGQQPSNLDAYNLVAQTAAIVAGLFADVSPVGAVVAFTADGAALATGTLVFKSDRKIAEASSWSPATIKPVVDDLFALAGDALGAFSAIANLFLPTKLIALEANAAADALIVVGLGFDLGSVQRTNVNSVVTNFEFNLSKAVASVDGLLPSSLAPTVTAVTTLLNSLVVLNSGVSGQQASHDVTAAYNALIAVEQSLSALFTSTGDPAQNIIDTAGATNKTGTLTGGSSAPTGTATDKVGINTSETGAVTTSTGHESYADTVSRAGVTTSTLTATAGSNVASETETISSAGVVTADTLTFAGMKFNFAPDVGSVTIEQDGSLSAVIGNPTTGINENIVEHPDGSVTFYDAFGTAFANYSAGALAGDLIKVVWNTNRDPEFHRTGAKHNVRRYVQRPSEFDRFRSNQSDRVRFKWGAVQHGGCVLNHRYGGIERCFGRCAHRHCVSSSDINVSNPGTIVVTAGTGSDTLVISGDFSSSLGGSGVIHFIGGTGSDTIDASAMTSHTVVELQAGSCPHTCLWGRTKY